VELSQQGQEAADEGGEQEGEDKMIDFDKLPKSMEQHILATLQEIRDTLNKQYAFHVAQLPVNERPKKK